MNRCTLALVLVLLAPVPGFAQDAEAPPGRKDPIIAFALEAVVPVLGHAYAGDARRGIAPAAVHVAGYGLLLYGVNEEFEDGDGRPLMIVGLAAAAVGKVWGLVSVAATVRERNASLVVEPAPDRGVAVGIRVNF